MILEIRDLSCRYVSRKKDTLSHVDLSLAEGEMVLIAGRSGCGKSTLIKSIILLARYYGSRGKHGSRGRSPSMDGT